MGDKVIPIGGVTRLDIDPDQILDKTKGVMDSIVIIGYDKWGDEYFASSIADGGDVLWLLERCKIKLMEVVD